MSLQPYTFKKPDGTPYIRVPMTERVKLLFDDLVDHPEGLTAREIQYRQQITFHPWEIGRELKRTIDEHFSGTVMLRTMKGKDGRSRYLLVEEPDLANEEVIRWARDTITRAETLGWQAKAVKRTIDNRPGVLTPADEARLEAVLAASAFILTLNNVVSPAIP